MTLNAIARGIAPGADERNERAIAASQCAPEITLYVFASPTDNALNTLERAQRAGWYNPIEPIANTRRNGQRTATHRAGLNGLKFSGARIRTGKPLQRRRISSVGRAHHS